MPKVSIIVPVYGVEKFIYEAVDSILAQTLKDIEIILIDDGGKDNCPKIIDEYAERDERIVAVHKPNGGYGQTCNVGLERATGEYVAILEPDDYIENNMYEELYKIAKANDSDVVKSAYYDNLQSPAEQKITKMFFENAPEGTITLKDYPEILSYHPSVWSCLYKREFLNKNNIRFIEAPGAGWTDNPFQIQTLCSAERMNITNEAYYYWRKVETTESERLKDYTIPFKRSDEIHEWMEKNNINDKDILSSLYIREFSYINLVLKSDISNFRDCFKRIKSMCKRMDKNIVFNLGKKYRKIYHTCMINPFIYYIKLNIKTWCRNIICIRLNRNEKFIRLFGRDILGGV